MKILSKKQFEHFLDKKLQLYYDNGMSIYYAADKIQWNFMLTDDKIYNLINRNFKRIVCNKWIPIF